MTETTDQTSPMTPTYREPDMRLGTVVVFMDENHTHNGSTEHPAIVTRVWGKGPRPTVNLTVIPDCAEPFYASSVQHWRERPGWPVNGKLNYVYREA